MTDKNLRRFWYVLFLIPTLLVFTVVFLIPVINVFLTSFCEWKLTIPQHFIGLRNYIEIFTEDLDFKVAVKNTLWWLLLQSTVHVGLGLAVALILFKKPFGWKFVRTSYFIPNVISVAAKGLLFTNIFHVTYGPVNAIIRLFDPDFTQNWFNNPRTERGTVQLGWLIYAGLICVILFAEMVNIPQEMLDAARIDGASGWQIDRRIILPMLRQALGTCVLLASTSMLKEFEFIYITTKGGPGNVTMNLPLMVYRSAMVNNNYGYANALGVLLILAGLATVFLVQGLFRFGDTDQ